MSQVTNVVTMAKFKAVGIEGCVESGAKASSRKRGSLGEEILPKRQTGNQRTLKITLGRSRTVAPPIPRSPFLLHTPAPLPLDGASKHRLCFPSSALEAARIFRGSKESEHKT